MSERRYAIEARNDAEAERVAYAVAHMAENKAYRHAAERLGGDPGNRLLEAYRTRFREYRAGWRGQPSQAIAQRLAGAEFAASGMRPLCVDIEVAAICDLACPFCFRQHIVTPDKIMSETLFRRLIAQCEALAVPSIKLNWRGEPLLHPRLPEFIDLAKRAGVLEVMINTNATRLDEATSHALIDAGLDQIIYSFDGGTRETYEAMRPGRFAPNSFAAVYGNIRRFAEIRRSRDAHFPRTKIQMILTEETFGEQQRFFALFEDCVDDVSVKAYTERGGALPDLDERTRAAIAPALAAAGVGHNAAYWRNLAGDLFVSRGRIACEQPYQRLMVTYDGRVSLCCYDWGSEHPVGYADEAAWARGEADFERVADAIASGRAGFAEFMADARLPRRHTDPTRQIATLEEIWTGALIDAVRERHACGAVEDVAICRRCPFKETYEWVQIPDLPPPLAGEVAPPKRSEAATVGASPDAD